MVLRVIAVLRGWGATAAERASTSSRCGSTGVCGLEHRGAVDGDLPGEDELLAGPPRCHASSCQHLPPSSKIRRTDEPNEGDAVSCPQALSRCCKVCVGH